jgi:hypothetical protein
VGIKIGITIQNGNYLRSPGKAGPGRRPIIILDNNKPIPYNKSKENKLLLLR